MLTIFTIPKPFINKHICTIQTNAIKSWLELPKVEVFLVGNDPGVIQVAKELKVKHIPLVAVNQYGTPLLNSAFDLVRFKTKNKILCYLNADVILLSDFMRIFKLLPKRNFLVVGQRWDLDIKKLIDFIQTDWEDRLKKNLTRKGQLHRSRGKAGSDYFIFHKGSFKELPAFAVGRVGWDNWMIYKARKQGMFVIDASPLVKVIHQNHGYAHQINKGKNKRISPEGKKNIQLAGGKDRLFNLQDTNWQLSKKGLRKKRTSFLRKLFSF